MVSGRKLTPPNANIASSEEQRFHKKSRIKLVFSIKVTKINWVNRLIFIHAPALLKLKPCIDIKQTIGGHFSTQRGSALLNNNGRATFFLVEHRSNFKQVLSVIVATLTYIKCRS